MNGLALFFSFVVDLDIDFLAIIGCTYNKNIYV